MTETADQTLWINNASLHYTQAGAGPVLLLIHGSLCDYRYWRWQMAALGSRCRVLAPSLRGYWPEALQDDDEHFGIDQHVQDLLAFINALSPGQPVYVLGHSRGAQVAAELALRAPDRIAGLILADPGFRLSDEAETPALHDQALAQIRSGNLDSGLASFVNAVNGQDIWKHMVSWFKTMVKDNARTLLSQAREVNRPVSSDALAQLQCPTLLVTGSNSPARYTSRVERLGVIMPDARRTTIALASHGMNLANPKAFNQAILSFLNHTALISP
jgi:pimeloyl-ACP methyl ester carboxylesterase